MTSLSIWSIVVKIYDNKREVQLRYDLRNIDNVKCTGWEIL